MNLLREKRRCLPDAGRLHFDGGSSSSSSTTNNYDQRVVGGDGSTNVSANVSGGSLTVTDNGAVAQAVDLAKTSVTTNADLATSLAKTSINATANSSASMFQGALAAVSDANKNLAQAYQNGNAGDQTQLKYAGFVVVGLAAVMLLSKFKG